MIKLARPNKLTLGYFDERVEILYLEEKCATMSMANYAVAVNNGTSAIKLALMAADIQAGDEVITTPYTWKSAIYAIWAAGGTPRFVDIDADYNIDPALIDEKITPKTKAIIATHLFGKMCDMNAIMSIARNYNLTVIEDACQATHATTEYDGKLVNAGGIGDMGIFSFYRTKDISCGEGGAVVTSNAVFDERLKLLRDSGVYSSGFTTRLGGNYRLSPVNAAMTSGQFFHDDLKRYSRQTQADILDEYLGPHPQNTAMPYCHKWHRYVIDCGPNRDSVRESLAASDIETGVYYDYLANYDTNLLRFVNLEDDTPRAAALSRNSLALPIGSHLTEEEVRKVGAACREAMNV